MQNHAFGFEMGTFKDFFKKVGKTGTDIKIYVYFLYIQINLQFMIKNIYKIHPFLQEDINNLIKDDIFYWD